MDNVDKSLVIEVVDGKATNIPDARPLRVAIIGSRRRNDGVDAFKLDEVFKIIANQVGWDEIILVSGGCREGGDEFCRRMHLHYGIPFMVWPPRKRNLESNTQWGWAKINHARNTEVATDCHIALALVASDRTGGTEDTIKKLIYYKKPIWYG